MTTNRVEMWQIEEAVDWSEHTANQAEVNAGQLKLEVDALVEVEIGAGPVSGAAESPRDGPPASGGAAPTLSRKLERLRDGLLASAAFYDKHGQHHAADVAREHAAKVGQ